MRAISAPLRMVAASLCFSGSAGSLVWPIAVGDMGVEVDQAGQHPFARPVDQLALGAWRPATASSLTILPSVIVSRRSCGHRAGPGIDQVPGAQLDGLGRGGQRRDSSQKHRECKHRIIAQRLCKAAA